LIVSDGQGGLVGKIPVAVEPAPVSDPFDIPQFDATSNSIFVASGSRVYRWSIPQQGAGGAADADEGDETEELYFVPRQSTFTIAARKTDLKHVVQGGKPPYDHFLVTRADGIELNDKTGSVVVDRDKMLESAMSVYSRYRQKLDPAQLKTMLQDRAKRTADAYRKHTGKKARGQVFAIPIHVKAVDQEGTVAQMQYFVLMDVPLKEIETRILSQMSQQ
jgi:hypothetical protein